MGQERDAHSDLERIDQGQFDLPIWLTATCLSCKRKVAGSIWQLLMLSHGWAALKCAFCER